jgi:hypothetical protein
MMTNECALRKVYYATPKDSAISFSELRKKAKTAQSTLTEALAFWMEFKLIEKVDLPKPTGRHQGNKAKFGYKRTGI